MHPPDTVNILKIYGWIPVVEDSSNDESPGDVSSEIDENDAIFFQEPLLAPVEDHDLSDPSNREADVLGICESDSQMENETPQLADEAYADEDWESLYSSEYGTEDEDSHQDVVANENEPESPNQIDPNITDDGEQPLYVGAPITLGISTLLIVTFAMTHSLSGEALSLS